MSDYSAIILCGGSGTRLAPITDVYPKPLVPVIDNEQKSFKSNLNRIIDIFRCYTNEIIVVVPPKHYDDYLKATSEYKNVSVVINDMAETTNNITSFKVGIESINSKSSGIYIIDGDSYFKTHTLICPEYSVFYVLDKGDCNEWSVIKNEDNKVVSFNKNGSKECLSGLSYICRDDIKKVKKSLNSSNINLNDYWESYIETILDKLNFKVIHLLNDDILEYDTIFDLMKINGIVDTLLLVPGITEVHNDSIGGMTNSNYLVTYNEEKYVVRIPGVGSDKFTHRQAEALMYKQLASTEITPEVIYLGPLKLTRYLDSYHVWNPLSDSERFKNIISKISEIHKLPKDNYPVLDPIKEVNNYNKIRVEAENDNQSKISIPDGYLKVGLWLSKQKFEFDSIVHGDLINSNILCDNDSDNVYLIDFEYTSICNRLWDLGDFLSEMSLIVSDMKILNSLLINMAMHIQDAYNLCNDRINSVYYKDIIKWCAITHYVWSAWGYARTALGDDQLNYAEIRLEQCLRCLRILKEEI